MKRFVALFLAVSMIFTGCSSQIDNSSAYSSQETTTEASIPENEGEEQTSLPETDTSTNATEQTSTPESNELPESSEAVPEFDSISDPALLEYMKDDIYDKLVEQLNSEDFFVENIEAVYLSKEYLDEVAFNSQSNIFFGYTLAEIEEQYQDRKYVFTLGDNGGTVVKAFEEYDDTFDEVIRNVAIGTGVILLCVTVSVISGGAGAAAVSMIFATAAKTGTIVALSDGLISGVSAGIATGIQTQNFDEAIKSAALAGSEGFKWGAITGAVMGGASQAVALKGATLNGLTMNQAAVIQKESKYPLDVIKQFHTIDEYKAFKDANLKPTLVGNKTALVRTDIDLTKVDTAGLTNLERIKKGKAPLDPNGNSYELHHIGQKKDGTLAIMSQSEHDNPAIHGFLKKSEAHAEGTKWDSERRAFWKAFAELVD